MKAYIKKNKWDTFLKNRIKYGYIEENDDFFAKRIEKFLLVCVHKKKREVILVTRIGIAAFTETHKTEYQELIDDDLIEFVKSEFD